MLLTRGSAKGTCAAADEKWKMQQARKWVPSAKSQRRFASANAEASALGPESRCDLEHREAKESRITQTCDSGKAAHDPNRFVEAIRIRGN
jgi:hypothetical protein